MATAKDYRVTFGYKAQDGYWYGVNGKVGLYHRGNDRSTPTGTPIVIGGTTIGLTGATGMVSGAHLHTQAGTDIGCQQTIDPTSLEFKTGRVVRTRATDSGQWGKYVTMKVDGKYITYAHLSSVRVEAGQVIKGENMKVTRSELELIFRHYLGRKPDKGALSHYVGNYTFDFVKEDVRTSDEAKKRRKRLAAIKAKQAEKDQVIKSLRGQIDSLSGRPNKDELEQAIGQVDNLTNDLERAEQLIKQLKDAEPVDRKTSWADVVEFIRVKINKFLRR